MFLPRLLCRDGWSHGPVLANKQTSLGGLSWRTFLKGQIGFFPFPHFVFFFLALNQNEWTRSTAAILWVQEGKSSAARVPAKSLELCLTLCQTIAGQVLWSMGFSRQEYWSELPCPSPGNLPNPGNEPSSPLSPALAGGFFPTSAAWEPPVPSLYLC